MTIEVYFITFLNTADFYWLSVLPLMQKVLDDCVYLSKILGQVKSVSILPASIIIIKYLPFCCFLLKRNVQYLLDVHMNMSI